MTFYINIHLTDRDVCLNKVLNGNLSNHVERGWYKQILIAGGGYLLRVTSLIAFLYLIFIHAHFLY